MNFNSINTAAVIDTFLLLLIGIGPKIALVPFLDATADMPADVKARVLRKMLTTATVVAVLLLVLGGLLTRLLHFSPGALGVASGIILMFIALSMIAVPQNPEKGSRALEDKGPMELAVFPLAVPYLLNPAGIVVLVTVSAEARALAWYGIVVAALVVVIGLDIAVFRWANRVSEHLDQSRLLVTEKVFGFLLGALAVQLALNGLFDLGVIHLTHH